MLQAYGIIGLLMLIFSEANFFLKIHPLDKLSFPIIWLGYILFIDSIVYWKKGKSLIKNNFSNFIAMFIISAVFWKIFEYINIIIKSWYYIGTEYFGAYGDLYALISFSTVIPAFFETYQLLGIDIKKAIPRDKIKKKSVYLFIALGIIFLILPLIFPKYFFPLIWIFLFLIIDPINYYSGKPSILYLFKTKQAKTILLLLVASLIMGFLWEFWNFYASVKWIYTIPFFNFWHIFEMPLFGYLGYIPFCFEVFSFYFFVESLFKKKLAR